MSRIKAVNWSRRGLTPMAASFGMSLPSAWRSDVSRALMERI
jgi:hypothetical protein